MSRYDANVAFAVEIGGASGIRLKVFFNGL